MVPASGSSAMEVQRARGKVASAASWAMASRRVGDMLEEKVATGYLCRYSLSSLQSARQRGDTGDGPSGGRRPPEAATLAPTAATPSPSVGLAAPQPQSGTLHVAPRASSVG